MPSPGGQVSRMASRENCCGRAGWAGCGIPSTSRRATTRQPGGRAGRRTYGFRRGLPPGWRVAGLCQVDGTPHELHRARSSMITLRLMIVWTLYGHKTHPDNPK